MDFTAFRIRAGVMGLLGFLCLLAVLFLWVGASVFGKPSQASSEPVLAEKLKALEGELREKELALAVQKKQIEEGQETSGGIAAPIPRGGQTSIRERRVASRAQTVEDGPLTSLPTPGGRGAGALLQEEGEQSPRVGAEERAPTRGAPARRTPEAERLRPAPESRQQASAEGDASRILNFNAEDVTVVAEAGNRGTIRFRLVKDQHDVRFAGYLFVFVEMVDKRGEHKVYAYPDRTRMGEGDDLPQDFRTGESLSFKYNSRVELPYSDVRTGANLARLSILLYGEDGNIVFQRGFSRGELKMVSAKATNVTDERPKPVKKRQAL